MVEWGIRENRPEKEILKEKAEPGKFCELRKVAASSVS